MISYKDKVNFSHAKGLAYYGEHRVRVGAVAVVNGKRISGAFNSSRNLPSVGWPNVTEHAEINCLCGIPIEKRSKAIVYVARISKNGKPMPSFPCENCLNSLASCVKRLVYFDGKGLVEHGFKRRKAPTSNTGRRAKYELCS